MTERLPNKLLFESSVGQSEARKNAGVVILSLVAEANERTEKCVRKRGIAKKLTDPRHNQIKSIDMVTSSFR